MKNNKFLPKPHGIYWIITFGRDPNIYGPIREFVVCNLNLAREHSHSSQSQDILVVELVYALCFNACIVCKTTRL